VYIYFYNHPVHKSEHNRIKYKIKFIVYIINDVAVFLKRHQQSYSLTLDHGTKYVDCKYTIELCIMWNTLLHCKWSTIWCCVCSVSCGISYIQILNHGVPQQFSFGILWGKWNQQPGRNKKNDNKESRIYNMKQAEAIARDHQGIAFRPGLRNRPYEPCKRPCSHWTG
jgi:hypothetical protein